MNGKRTKPMIYHLTQGLIRNYPLCCVLEWSGENIGIISSRCGFDADARPISFPCQKEHIDRIFYKDQYVLCAYHSSEEGKGWANIIQFLRNINNISAGIYPIGNFVFEGE